VTLSLPNYSLRVEADRFGPFTFQIGCEERQIELLFLRVSDAQQRLIGSPFAQVAHHLEKEVVVSSVFGTNTIEGGTLSEEETAHVLDMDPEKVQEIEQRRVVNIKKVYEFSRKMAESKGWQLNLSFFNSVHALLTDKIPDEYNKLGVVRNNSRDLITYVGSPQHGGKYKPPQLGKDIKKLLSALVQFNEELLGLNVPVLIRAPLVHFYYELIHPYWDGNGRVGRIVEATLLHAEGFRYAPFAQAGFYLKNIDQYFTLFSTCRKAAKKGREYPNMAFVQFFLEGMLESLNTLHDQVNNMVKILIFENRLRHLLDEKTINKRQYAIVKQITSDAGGISLKDLRKSPWYDALYSKLSGKTSLRDIAGLNNLNLIFKDENDQIWPGILKGLDAKDLQR